MGMMTSTMITVYLYRGNAMDETVCEKEENSQSLFQHAIKLYRIDAKLGLAIRICLQKLNFEHLSIAHHA
jgi:hypothetical protein